MAISTKRLEICNYIAKWLPFLVSQKVYLVKEMPDEQDILKSAVIFEILLANRQQNRVKVLNRLSFSLYGVQSFPEAMAKVDGSLQGPQVFQPLTQLGQGSHVLQFIERLNFKEELKEEIL